MTIVSLGKITVATSGTAKQVITTSTMAWKVMFEPLPGNTGNSYVGVGSTLVGSTGVGVIKTFIPVGTSGLNDSFTIEADDQGNSIDVSQFYLDVATNTQGFVVSYATK